MSWSWFQGTAGLEEIGQTAVFHGFHHSLGCTVCDRQHGQKTNSSRSATRGVPAVFPPVRRTPSMYSASAATVAFLKKIRRGIFNPQALRSLDTTRMANNECPPS